MLFEVVRCSDNRPMMCTEYESCIPYEQLKSMTESGYYFRLDGKKVSENTVQSLQKRDKSVREAYSNKSVRCIDTGEIFKNQAEAARHFNIDPAQVSDSIKTGRPRSGHTFEKVVN